MIHLRSLGTKEFSIHRTCLKEPSRRSIEQVTPWSRIKNPESDGYDVTLSICTLLLQSSTGYLYIIPYVS